MSSSQPLGLLRCLSCQRDTPVDQSFEEVAALIDLVLARLLVTHPTWTPNVVFAEHVCVWAIEKGGNVFGHTWTCSHCFALQEGTFDGMTVAKLMAFVGREFCRTMQVKDAKVLQVIEWVHGDREVSRRRATSREEQHG